MQKMSPRGFFFVKLTYHKHVTKKEESYGRRQINRSGKYLEVQQLR